MKTWEQSSVPEPGAEGKILHIELQAWNKESNLGGYVWEAFYSQSLPRKANFIQLGHIPFLYPNSATNQGSSIQMPNTMVLFVIQTTIHPK